MSRKKKKIVKYPTKNISKLFLFFSSSKTLFTLSKKKITMGYCYQSFCYTCKEYSDCSNESCGSACFHCVCFPLSFCGQWEYNMSHGTVKDAPSSDSMTRDASADNFSDGYTSDGSYA